MSSDHRYLTITLPKNFIPIFDLFLEKIGAEAGFHMLLDKKLKRETIKGNKDMRINRIIKEKKLTSMKIRYLIFRYVESLKDDKTENNNNKT